MLGFKSLGKLAMNKKQTNTYVKWHKRIWLETTTLLQNNVVQKHKQQMPLLNPTCLVKTLNN